MLFALVLIASLSNPCDDGRVLHRIQAASVDPETASAALRELRHTHPCEDLVPELTGVLARADEMLARAGAQSDDDVFSESYRPRTHLRWFLTDVPGSLAAIAPNDVRTAHSLLKCSAEEKEQSIRAACFEAAMHVALPVREMRDAFPRMAASPNADVRIAAIKLARLTVIDVRELTSIDLRDDEVLTGVGLAMEFEAQRWLTTHCVDHSIPPRARAVALADEDNQNAIAIAVQAQSDRWAVSEETKFDLVAFLRAQGYVVYGYETLVWPPLCGTE